MNVALSRQLQCSGMQISYKESWIPLFKYLRVFSSSENKNLFKNLYNLMR